LGKKNQGSKRSRHNQQDAKKGLRERRTLAPHLKSRNPVENNLVRRKISKEEEIASAKKLLGEGKPQSSQPKYTRSGGWNSSGQIFIAPSETIRPLTEGQEKIRGP